MLNRELTRRLVYGQPDVINATDTQLLDIMVSADSCAYPSFDLKKIWLTERRWQTMIKQYVDPDLLSSWLELITDRLTDPGKRGIAHMRSKTVSSHVNPSTGREWRRWGSCMLGWSYRSRPYPVITLYSRTSYLGYIGQLDLAVSSLLAHEIGKRVGLDVSDISFVWHLGAGQFHAFKSLAWFYQNKNDQMILEGDKWPGDMRQKMPTLWLARRTLGKIKAEDESLKGYGEHNFNQMLRIRRRYHAEVTGQGANFTGGEGGRVNARNTTAFLPLPSVPLSRLSLASVMS